MIKRIFAAISIAFLITVFLFFEYNLEPQIEVEAENGVLDLRNIDIHDMNTINLKGTWEFYPEQFISNIDNKKSGAFVNVPGDWRKTHKLKKTNSYGYGTYHIKILLNEKDVDQMLGIKVSSIRTAHEIFINGNKISEMGNIGISRDEYTPRNKSYVKFFKSNNSEIDISILVSNYDSVKFGGIMRPIYLGTEENIINLQENMVIIETVISSFLISISLFCFIRYIFDEKKKTAIYLGLFSLSLVSVILTNGEDLVYKLFPQICYRHFEILHLVVILINILLFLSYTNIVLPYAIRDNEIKVIRRVISTTIFISLFLDNRIHNFICQYIALIYVFIVIIISLRVITGLMLRNIESYIFMSSIAAILIGIITYIPVAFICEEYRGSILGISMVIFAIAQYILIIHRQNNINIIADKKFDNIIDKENIKKNLVTRIGNEVKISLDLMKIIIDNIILSDENEFSKSSLEKIHIVRNGIIRLNSFYTRVNDIYSNKFNKDLYKIRKTKINDILDGIKELYNFIYADKNITIEINFKNQEFYVAVDYEKIIYALTSIIDCFLLNIYIKNVTISVDKKICGMEIDISGYFDDSLENLFEESYEEIKNTANKDALSDLAVISIFQAKDIIENFGGSLRYFIEVDDFKEIKILLPIENIEYEKLLDNHITNVKIAKQNINKTLNEKHKDRENIVVIDDDLGYTEIIKNTLSNEQYNVWIVNSNEANELDYFKYDLIIVNIFLLDASSLEICKYIRRHFDQIELPILILSSPIDSNLINKALKRGVNDIIQKPIYENELKMRIKSHLTLKKLSESKTSYELAFLNAQIKPHFIFNTLNTLLGYVETDIEEAEKFIISLSRFLRGTLNFSNTEKLITLAHEMKIIEAYLSIETSRYNNLNINYDIDNINMDNIQIPPLTMQILIENIVKHVLKSLQENVIINLKIKNHDEFVMIIIEDNGGGIDKNHIVNILNTPKQNGSIGIYNVNHRLRTLCDSKLEYSTSEHGTTVMFKLKYGGI